MLLCGLAFEMHLHIDFVQQAGDEFMKHLDAVQYKKVYVVQAKAIGKIANPAQLFE